MRRGILIGSTLLCMTGCQQAKMLDANDPLLGTKVDATLSRLTADENRISRLEQAIGNDILLKRSDDGFSTFHTDIGILTLQLIAVEDNGGVAQARIRIGNPTSATITRMQIFANWGQLDKDGAPTGDSHSFEPTISTPVRAGSWTLISVPIEGAHAADVGYIKVMSGSINSMKLNREV